MTVRHIEISDELREYAEEKVLRLKKYLDRIHHTEVIMDGVGDEVRMSIHISAVKGQTFSADSQGATPKEAIDATVDKMERQLNKYKEKLKGKDRKSSGRMRAIKEADMSLPTDDEDEPTYQDIVDNTDIPENEDRD